MKQDQRVCHAIPVYLIVAGLDNVARDVGGYAPAVRN